MFGAAPSRKIFAYVKPTDMRKSFHGLLALVQKVFSEHDAYSGNLFVFVNRRGNYIKILAGIGRGFLFMQRSSSAVAFSSHQSPSR